MKIVIGHSAEGKPVAFDLDTLITTRLLIQANSGAGKSWLLRRLAEQLFPHVQVIIVDPEGEFATLREKFGFVLVGKGGEAAADVRLAGDVALKLLELRASAVCDLYELKSRERHQWVKAFLERLIDAPKNLWHPTVVIVDEAHVFCPEKGESEAQGSVIDLATRGRKRGFCAIAATQRLAQLNKDFTSGLLNRLVGGTFEDVDVKRALELLSVPPEQKREFSLALRTLDPGSFYALGRAIAKERLLFKVGDIETTHPKSGSAKHAAAPPPPPEKVRDLLPKLADLPKEAQERATTIEDLKAQIRSLRSELAQARKVAATSAPVFDQEKARATAEKLARGAVKERDAQWTRSVRDYQKRVDELLASRPRFEQPAIAEVSSDAIPAFDEKKVVIPGRQRIPIAEPRKSEMQLAPAIESGNGHLPGAQQRILNAVRTFEAIGRASVSKKWIAAVAGVSYKSSGYNNNLGALRSAGLISYPAPSQVALTDGGRAKTAAVSAPDDPGEMLDYCKQICTPAQGKILEELFYNYPRSLPKTQLAEQVGVSASSSGYNNNLGALRSAGMIEYPTPGEAKCAAWIYLEEAA